MYISKQLWVITSWLVFLCAGLMSCHAATARTTFIPRSITNNALLECALSNFRLRNNSYINQPYDAPSLWSAFAFQSTYVYQSSMSGSSLGSYFFPNGTNSVRIRETGCDDVASPWINLTSCGEGIIDGSMCIAPQRSTFGALARLFFDGSAHIPGLWGALLVATVWAEHELEPFDRMFGAQAGSLCAQRPIEAFNSPAWLYGKMRPCKLSEWLLDDMLLKIGWSGLQGVDGQLSIYGAVMIPMGNTPRAEFVFEPVIGNGGHWELGTGCNGNVKLVKWGKHELFALTDFCYRYGFSSRERRSFDLCANGPWSRYLLVAQPGCPSVACPGINTFTRDVDVTPRSLVDWWFALHYRHESWNFEIGGDLWWRAAQCVELSQCWDDTAVGIFDLGRGITSASTARICQHANELTPDATFTTVTMRDINLKSAAHPQAWSISGYLAGSFDAKFFDLPTLYGLGASFEWPPNNAALTQWSVWGKTTMSF